ncbi:hypothetical protein PoMZ_04209 [Pyricularia oryzae]|uniref:Uncharacterized protein n=1 Tax=Pyricularia oryzae TaxID=318829 RepID=A0A4P7N977_PYROR|nr:hypothetical protein PoMZ_04209 [Pyricularia oryzae]
MLLLFPPLQLLPPLQLPLDRLINYPVVVRGLGVEPKHIPQLARIIFGGLTNPSVKTRRIHSTQKAAHSITHPGIVQACFTAASPLAAFQSVRMWCQNKMGGSSATLNVSPATLPLARDGSSMAFAASRCAFAAFSEDTTLTKFSPLPIATSGTPSAP